MSRVGVVDVVVEQRGGRVVVKDRPGQRRLDPVRDQVEKGISRERRGNEFNGVTQIFPERCQPDYDRRRQQQALLERLEHRRRS